MDTYERQCVLVDRIQTLISEAISADEEISVIDVIGALETVKLGEWRRMEEIIDRGELLDEDDAE